MKLKDVRNDIGVLRALTPAYTRVQQHLSLLHDFKDFPDARLTVIYGKAGLGKSAACEAFAKKQPCIEVDRTLHMPVIYIKLWGTDKLNQLLDKLIYALRQRECITPSQGSAKLSLIMKLLKKMSTKLIIIDEFQHILPKTQNVTGRMGEIVNTVKTLVEVSNINVALVGMPATKQIYDFADKHEVFEEQAEQRSFTPLEVPMIDNITTQKLMRLYIKSLAAKNIEASILIEHETLGRLILLSQGCIRILSYVVQQALFESDGRIIITKASIEAAARQQKCYRNEFDIRRSEVIKKLSKWLGECA